MLDISRKHHHDRPHTWLAEALLVAGILVFGGFALLSDAHLTVGELLSGATRLLGL